jgi:hypothetical protein
VAGQFVSRLFVVLLRKSIPQKTNLQTAAVLSVTHNTEQGMYVQYHEHFSNEVYQATAFYVIWKNLQNRPALDKELLEALCMNPLSWNFIRHSMMVSLIMTLGRIFDTDGESVSIDDLVKSCINEIQLFSKSSLRQRKLVSHNASEWIDSYMERVYEPQAQDFHKLKPHVKKYREIYNEYYKPLRHKLFAHSDRQYHSQSDELFKATKNANMEEVLNFLQDLNVAIREAYLNGRKPELRGIKFDEAWFANDIQALLNRVKNV